MNKRLFVGNVPFSLSELSLTQIFSIFGVVASVRIVINHLTGKSLGYAYVEMLGIDSVGRAITALDGCDIGGRRVNVAPAKVGFYDGSRFTSEV